MNAPNVSNDATTVASEATNEVADELVDAAEPVGTTIALIDPLLKLQLTLVELKAEGDAATWDVDTTEGEEAARKFRARCVSARTSADAEYAKGNKPLLAAQKKARDLVAAIKLFVAPIEAKWDAKIVAKEQRKAEEKRVRDEAAKKKLLEIRQRIAFITEAPMRASICKTAAAMAEVSAELEATVFNEELFGDFVEEARGAAERAQAAITQLHDAAVERENAAAVLLQQQQKLARQQAELARVATINGKLSEISEMARLDGMTAVAMQARIDALQSTRMQESVYQEFVEKAENLKAAALVAMRRALAVRNEADAEAKRLDDQRIANETAAADLKRQTDAFEKEKRVAREKLAADQAAITEAANKELDSLAALQEAHQTESDAAIVESVFSPVMPDEPAVTTAANAPVIQRPRRPDDVEILTLVTDHFKVSMHEALEWISSFDVSVQRNNLRRAA